MDKKYTYEEFLEIIKTLRSENGCPWDRTQTHDSLRPCMAEEAAEVLAAIRIYEETGDAENLQEELGDVLLQVVMHSEIAAEEGIFTMEDVVNHVAQKMIRRHPHVFGDKNADNPAEALGNWEEAKKKEKQGKRYIESPLREIPMELSALSRAQKVLKKADDYYGRHTEKEEEAEYLKTAAERLKLADKKGDADAVAKELGDILMMAADIGRQYKLPLEQILSDRVDDFVKDCEGHF